MQAADHFPARTSTSEPIGHTDNKCEQCVSKDLECTSNYIEQLQNKPRRPRRFKSNEEHPKERRPSDHELRSPGPAIRRASAPKAPQSSQGSSSTGRIGMEE